MSSSRPGSAIDRTQVPRLTGTLIGTVGALAFVIINSAALSAPMPTVGIVLAALLLGVIASAVLVRPVRIAQQPPRRGAGIVYFAGLVGMFAIMSVGSRVAAATGHAAVQPAIVVLGVGVHFIPFAWAFRARVFGVIGVTMASLALLGIVAGVAGPASAPRWAAIAAGVAMILIMAAHARGRLPDPAA